MNIEKLFSDKTYLEKEIGFFLSKKHLRRIDNNSELAVSHLRKARHNLEFYKLNKKHPGFYDWLVVVLYYSLYHAALALITNRNYASKNHYATILILIKEYSISQTEAELIDELSISKRDAELYTYLKKDRHDASYHTELVFEKEKIEHYEEHVMDFINKAQRSLEK